MSGCYDFPVVCLGTMRHHPRGRFHDCARPCSSRDAARLGCQRAPLLCRRATSNGDRPGGVAAAHRSLRPAPVGCHPLRHRPVGPLGGSAGALHFLVEPLEPSRAGLHLRHRPRCGGRGAKCLPQRGSAPGDLRPAPRAHAQPCCRLLRPDRRPYPPGGGGSRRQAANHPHGLRRVGLDDDAHRRDRTLGERGLRFRPWHGALLPGLRRCPDRVRVLLHEPRERRHEGRRRRPGPQEPWRRQGWRLRRGDGGGNAVGPDRPAHISDRP